MNLHELIDRLHKEHTLTKEEFIKIVENFAVPAGKGESGRDHVQSVSYTHLRAHET